MSFQVLVALGLSCSCFASRTVSKRLLLRASTSPQNPTACIAPDCRTEPPENAAAAAHLCYDAFRNAKICTRAWQELLQSAARVDCGEYQEENDSAITCEGSTHQELDRQMFGDIGCSKMDLCSIAGAKINAYSVACKESNWSSFYCDDIIVPADVVEGLRTSLQCRCLTLNDGGGRSGAVLQITHDHGYIVKGIKSDEMPVLESMYSAFENYDVLSKWSYIDPKNTLVIMPNSHDVSTRGLQATLGVTYASMEPRCEAWRGSHVDVSFSGGWDVKPLPIKSPHRKSILALLAERQWKPKKLHGWTEVTENLQKAIDFLSKRNLIDYSLLFSLFASTAKPSDGSCRFFTELQAPHSQCLVTPSCAVGHRAAPIRIANVRPKTADRDSEYQVGGPPRDYFLSNYSSLLQQHSENGKCEALCVTIIDYLMVFDTKRWLENEFKGGRWTSYADKSMKLWFCLGDLQAEGCEQYLQLACQELDANEKTSSWCSGTNASTPVVDDGDLDLFFTMNSTDRFDDWKHISEGDAFDEDLTFAFED